jgi:hypothetical protein
MGESMEQVTLKFTGTFAEQIVHHDLFPYAYSQCVKRIIKDGHGILVPGKKYLQMDEDELSDRLITHLREAEDRFSQRYSYELSLDHAEVPRERHLPPGRMKELLKEALDTIYVEG